jgi:membrane-associated phospholipid phosphatase
MKIGLKQRAGVFTGILCLAGCAWAQDSNAPQLNMVDVSEQSPTVGGDFKRAMSGVWKDQKMMFLSPLSLKPSDATWLVPMGGIAAGLFATDHRISHEATRNSHTNTAVSFSNAGLAAMGGTVGAMYLLGVRNSNDHLRETGLLAAEAAADSFEVDEILKYALQRQRPDSTSQPGAFFQGASAASFPSAHATTTFAMATVIADEYPGWMTKTMVYGLATAVSAARVVGEQHFPSDVFIGGTLGYLIGHNVYKHRHIDDGLNYGTFERTTEPLAAARMSSTYIELDSWIYPAVERLAAMGVINSAYLGLRPWTRMSVYAMLANADESKADREGQKLLADLKEEFKREQQLDQDELPNQAIKIDRVYTRFQYISGNPLTDGFHFGQTIINDFGRPFGPGLQEISGFESRAEKGRFSFFVRGEYQHTPGTPGYNANVTQVLNSLDFTPGKTYGPVAAQNQFRLLDTYASINVLSNEITVGKQTFWWGPDDSTAMMINNNIEPIYAIRINRTIPLKVPLLSKLTGPIRYDNFFGRLEGNTSPADPFIYGNKISLHPTDNLEFGFSRQAIFAGTGLEPLTFHTFFKSFFSTSSGTYAGFNPRDTPGARHANFDFRYKLPYLRNWVTLYTDSFVHDDVSPIDAPRHAAIMPGIYLAKFPKFNKLDLHVEGGTTDPVTTRAEGGNYFYFEGNYKDSYNNKNQFMGSYLGREGTGGQAWATYWFNPKSTLMVGYRTVKVSHTFLPQGETQQDYYGTLNYEWKNGLGVQLMLQQERWVAPLLASGPQHDFTTRFGVFWEPKDMHWEKRK